MDKYPQKSSVSNDYESLECDCMCLYQRMIPNTLYAGMNWMTQFIMAHRAIQWVQIIKLLFISKLYSCVTY